MNPFGLLVSIKDYSIWDLFLRVQLPRILSRFHLQYAILLVGTFLTRLLAQAGILWSSVLSW